MDNDGRKRRRTCVKRDEVAEKLRSASTVLPVGLLVTADQLQNLWRHDNECGRKYMNGCPLRTCKADGEESSHNHSNDLNKNTGLGLTTLEMMFIKSAIKEMWQQAGTMFEIFMNNSEKHEGYRLRVRKDLAVKITIREQDAVQWGWIAIIPTDLSTAHVFQRSCVEPNGYLGGPVSYMNWCQTSKQQVTVMKSISNARHICKMWTNSVLSPGTELRWDYGCSRYMPESGLWFKDECCSVSTVDPTDLKRHKQHDKCREYIFRELCVLCGFPYSVVNKENRFQRKQHWAGRHADFLGSEWDGTGPYDQQIVDPDVLFCKADELNYLLSSLKKLNWNVILACTVFTQEELDRYGDDENSLMEEFEIRFHMFKKGGTLVLRGTDVPSAIAHFKSVEPRPWKVISWKNNVKPPEGRYAVSPDLKEAHELHLPKLLSNFCEKYLNNV